ncbi:MAG: LysR family transcriptional regulator [Pseudomonadota bacterium]
MPPWNTIQTALTVARCGTVKAAAALLGLHRATVLRHIDALERELATPLFQRHARGVTLTEAGEDLVAAATRAEALFEDLAGRTAARESQLSGELVVTALAGITPLVMPAVHAFQLAHPAIAIRFNTGEHLAKLETGEAHVAFRPGPKPTHPDYVVQPFCRVRFGLYATPAYVQRCGTPTPETLSDHRFVGSIEPSPLPYADWLATNVRPDQLALETANQQATTDAVALGVGLGFIAEHDAAHHADWLTVLPPDDDRAITVWLATHVDLRRTQKVQSFFRVARQAEPLPTTPRTTAAQGDSTT